MGNNLKRAIGRRIRAAREAKSLSQEELAGRISRSVRAVSDIERGVSAPSLDTLNALSVQLGVPMGTFFDGVQELTGLDANRLDKETTARVALRRLSDANLDIALKQLQVLVDSQ